MFWTTFWAMLSALAVMEVFHFGVGLHFARKQEKEIKKFQQEMEDKGVDPMASMLSFGMPPIPAGSPAEVPKANGDDDKTKQTGQYL